MPGLGTLTTSAGGCTAWIITECILGPATACGTSKVDSPFTVGPEFCLTGPSKCEAFVLRGAYLQDGATLMLI